MYNVHEASETQCVVFALCLTHKIRKLKLQVDDGQQLLEVSVNVSEAEDEAAHIPSPNSILKDFVIVMTLAVETDRIRGVLYLRSLRSLFDMKMIRAYNQTPNSGVSMS